MVGLWLFVNAGSNAVSTAGGITSIAVLPVKSLTEQDRDPIYELGIADALIARLSPTENLVVRQLDAMKEYDGVEKNAVEVGKEQKVDYVLAPHYQIADKKVRITAQLIRVSTGAVEDVFRFDESGPDRFAVQDAAAIHLGNSVLKRLNREVATTNPKRYTTNEEAYSLDLQGTRLADSRDRKAIQAAVEYFERAVTLDPNFALAYAGLANAHTGLSIHGGEKGPDEYHKAKAAIEKALAIDDTVAEAHTYLGELKSGIVWDFEGAAKEYKRGIELNPSSSAAHRMYALMLGCIGRADEAVSEIRTAIDLDPASALNHKLFTRIAYLGRRYDEAIAEGRLSLNMDPLRDVVSEYIIDAYLQKGEADQAFDWFVKYHDLAGEPANEIAAWKRAYSRGGWRGVRERQIALTLHDEKDDSFQSLYLARLYSRQGEIERAFMYIDKAFAMRLWGDVKLIADPAFDPLRSDPRYAVYLAKLNIKQ
jgi:TolB-like protein/Tfp pilus assembly protein PilF